MRKIRKMRKTRRKTKTTSRRLKWKKVFTIWNYIKLYNILFYLIHFEYAISTSKPIGKNNGS
jgi:hypothetical protein